MTSDEQKDAGSGASVGLTPFPGEELSARHARIGAALAEAGIDAVLLATSGNLFYATGLALDSYAWVRADGSATWMVKRGLRRAEAETGFCGELKAIRSLKEIPERVGLRSGETFRLGLELDTIPQSVFVRMQGIFGESVELVDASDPLREVRAVKSDWEVEQIRAAAQQSLEVFELLPSLLREGRREVEVAADIEQHIRAQGHPMMFPVHRWGHRLSPVYFCAGETATLPGVFMGPIGGSGLSGADPHGAGRKVIRRNEPLIADICCAHGGYISDQTKTFVLGELPAPLQSAYDLSVRIRDEVVALLQPGADRTAPFERAQAMAADAGLAEQFMGLGTDRLNFIGHGLGIEIDELPVLAPRQKGTLAEGMILAIEPKFFFAGQGAVGIEDTYVVRANGPERITGGTDALVVCD